MGTSNSISSLLAQFMRLETNAMEILSKLSEATSSAAETITMNIVDDAGKTQQIKTPSFGFLKSEINRIDTNIQQLSGLGDSSAVIKLPDGSTKKIFQSSILRDPTTISSLPAPALFKIKNNWFFENFLNPLLFVGLDLTGKVPDNMTKAVVKRVILNTDTQAKKDLFDKDIKGRTDVDLATLFDTLDANAIQYFLDDEIVDMPASVMQFRGSFDVYKVVDEEVNITSNNTTITVKKRKYKLSQLTYTDILSGTDNSKTLKLGDVLITIDGSQYVIESLDAAEITVVLRRISGSQPIAIGVNILEIQSPAYTSKEIQVGVGYDERQIVFIKPIDPNFNVASSQYSPGTAFWSNELTITTPSGNVTLDVFYKSQVTDFGLQFINAAKEKTIPSVFGEVPDFPTLDIANFQVIQINEHKTNTTEADAIKQQLSSKVKLDNEIKQLDDSITSKKNDLNNNSGTRSAAETAKIKADLNSFAIERVSKVNLYDSLVKQLASTARANPSITEPAKYSVRGFWPMPVAKSSDKTQDQEVVQFRIAHRYISKDGNAPGTKKMDFTDINGNKSSGYFSNWTEDKSDIRKRIYNPTTGFFEWEIEDVTDPDKVNINQISVAISSGEQVQFRVKSVSEAGWPLNPLESDWSDIITVTFPDNLQIQDQSATILNDASQEETRVNFQQELNSRGLDLHLLSSFTSGDKYFAHRTDDVASGYFDAAGKVINLFDKLKQLDTDLQNLRLLVLKAKGTLSIFLLDQDGNVTKVTSNSTTKLFAGFYKDLVTIGSGTATVINHGQIVTKSYTVRVENSAATPLELASMLPGGQSEAIPFQSVPTNADFDKNRRYDIVPISLTGAHSVPTGGLKQEAPFQSRQTKGEWLYSRERSVGLDTDLYAPQSAFNLSLISAAYIYRGVPISGNLVPVNGYHLLPFDPTWNPGPWVINPNVWNGQVAGTSAVGGGRLSEFCIHVNHPDLVSAAIINTYTGSTNWSAANIGPNGQGSFQALAPLAVISGSGGGYVMQYPKFIHALYFSDESSAATGQQQLTTVIPIPAGPSTGAPATNDTHYPPKLGFTKNDEFLVGKYTCGAYMYLSTADYKDIATDGATDAGKYLLEFGEDKGINIPLIFQFRCSDKLGYVGGYRLSGTVNNVTYIKKVGIDIQVRGESAFSFDVECTCKYQQDSIVHPTFVPNIALDRLNSIRSQQVA